MNIKSEIAALENELIELRRDFHRHPELGLNEVRTSAIVYEYLKALGLGQHRINTASTMAVHFEPSTSCKFLEIAPLFLQNLQSYLTKNSFAIILPYLCGITLEVRCCTKTGVIGVLKGGKARQNRAVAL